MLHCFSVSSTRFDYTMDKINWADMICAVGGDGTFLLAAGRVTDNQKPVIGFNSDPRRSEGYLSLHKKYSSNIEEAVRKLKQVSLIHCSLETQKSMDTKYVFACDYCVHLLIEYLFNFRVNLNGASGTESGLYSVGKMFVKILLNCMNRNFLVQIRGMHLCLFLHGVWDLLLEC